MEFARGNAWGLRCSCRAANTFRSERLHRVDHERVDDDQYQHGSAQQKLVQAAHARCARVPLGTAECGVEVCPVLRASRRMAATARFARAGLSCTVGGTHYSENRTVVGEL